MQHILKGENAIQKAGSEIARAGCKTVFLVSGSHFLKTHELDFLNGLDVFHYIKKGSNVEEGEVTEAAEIFNRSGSQSILAVGGGSVMDLAKGIIYQLVQRPAPVPLFIAVPTTAGSGSEATAFAVVYKGKKKFSLVHPSLLPETVILDPVLTYSLPAFQTAVTGMDAFAQAIESYWSRNATTESKEYSAKAISLCNKHLLNVVKNGNDETGRRAMLEAANFAGKAINITRTTGPHALSYFLTANYNVPHGQAVALFLPLFFIYNSPDSDLCSLIGAREYTEASQLVKQLMKKAGLATTLAEIGIQYGNVSDALLDEVNEERFANNPVPFDREKLKLLLTEHI